ncbi:ankyrin repeat-containing domain protein [Rhexocercosporidium sp. MPI-PUGE-AT-0058]|nr:ankyrin repeat-containing domain protein [Rhexocercosporidium sp. MPI-PUGE-AT-0058]
MSFGFSVGDFVATILLIKDVTQALHSSTGSASEVKELSEHLESLMQAMIISTDVYRLGGLDTLRIETRFAMEAIRAGIEVEHMKCREVLESFMKSLKPYTNSLVRGHGLSLIRQVRKVTWLHRKDDVAKLQRSIGNHLRNLTMYNSALNEIYATDNARRSEEILTNILEIRLELTNISGAVRQKYSSIPRNLGYPWEANDSKADTVILLDAIGRNVTLPLTLLGSTKDLHDILVVMYRNIKGREKILRKEYTITDESSDGALIDDMNWNKSIEGGMQLSLNIVFPALESFDDMRCPSCQEKSLGTTLPGKRRRCHKCQFTFRIFDRERIVEEEEEQKASRADVDINTSPMATSIDKGSLRPDPAGKPGPAKNSANDDFLFRSVHYHREIRKFKKPSKPKVQEGEIPTLVLDELPPLHKAAALGSVAEIGKLLDQKINVDTPLQYNAVISSHSCEMLEEFGGCTPLHLACWFGHLPAITALLDKGADILARASSCSEEVLGYAILGEKPERIFHFLVSKGARLDYRDRTGISPFINACAAGISFLLPVFLDCGVNVNTTTDFGYTALGLAAHGAHERTFEMLLDQAAVIGFNDRGWSALHYAAAYGWTAIIQSLLERGEDANALDTEGCLPLHVAARWEKSEACKFLLDHTANINLVTKTSMTVLHWASIWGLNEIIELLVQKGADCNIGDEHNYTSLHYASSRPSLESTVRLLLQSGARVNAASKDLETPIIQAAWFDNTKVVEVLLENGANVNATTASGYTPLHFASWRGYNSLVETLLNHGANIEAQTKTLTTPLHRAAIAGETSTVELLLQKGANVHARAKDLSTTLHWATGSKSTETLELLLQHGAEIDAFPDSSGLTPVAQAARLGKESIAKVLLTHGSTDLDSQDPEGRTALHWACLGGFESTARILIENGAKLVADSLGRTPLHDAVYKGSEAVTKLLLDIGADPFAKLNPDITLACWSKHTLQNAASVNDTEGPTNFPTEKSPIPRDKIAIKDEQVIKNVIDIARNRGWTGIAALLSAAVARSSA